MKLAVWNMPRPVPPPKNDFKLLTKSATDMVCEASDPAPVPKSLIGAHNSPNDIDLGAEARKPVTSFITTGMKKTRIVAKTPARMT